MSERFFDMLLSLERWSRERGLSVTDLAILGAAADGITMGALAENLAVSTAAVTGLADKLQGLGLLFRKVSVADRRKVFVLLTDAGRELLALVCKMIDKECAGKS